MCNRPAKEVHQALHCNKKWSELFRNKKNGLKEARGNIPWFKIIIWGTGVQRRTDVLTTCVEAIFEHQIKSHHLLEGFTIWRRWIVGRPIFSRSSFDIGRWWSNLPNPCRFNSTIAVQKTKTKLSFLGLSFEVLGSLSFLAMRQWVYCYG